MAIAAKVEDLPLGVIRGGFGNGNVACIVDSQMPIVAEVFRELAGSFKKRYWVFVLDAKACEKNSKEFTYKEQGVKAKKFQFDTYDEAEAKYVALGLSDLNKKAIKAGYEGLRAIGSSD